MVKNIWLYILMIFCCVTKISAQSSFSIVKENISAPIVYSGEDGVVNNAIDMFIADTKLVAKEESQRVSQIKDGAIVVYNLDEVGSSDEIDKLLGVEISYIKDSWEMFYINQVNIDNKRCLVVIGSDSRGAAYGVLELSRKIGVSPWSWWADVKPKEQESVILEMSEPIKSSPSVQYRGIFLNDEDWALLPWSYKSYENESLKGEMGPRTYSRIFELLLRLRGNTIWPAMHECTTPFYLKDGNKEMAEKYGIIVGTSHCEPMMRCSASEWDSDKYGSYNYITNKERVEEYWRERVEELVDGENIYTLGMRGVHDGRMQGVSTIDSETALLQTIIEAQQELLSEYHNDKAETIPQVFVPYKEVLNAYDNGLKLPDNVTIMWCDDNQGYITRLSDAQEQKRSGGAGVYYHISYWGKPHDYLWLATTSPGLIYCQMKRAWDYGAQKMWILNVGDIKPAEYLMELFLDMAWDINSISPSSITSHREQWGAFNLEPKLSKEITNITDEYYALAAHRRPEHMGWNRVEASKEMSSVHDSQLNPFVFGDEIEQRLSRYQDIVDKSCELYTAMPASRKDSYFQLIHYPILACDAMNRKMLYAQKARLYGQYNLPVADEYSKLSNSAYYEIASLTYTYNKDIAKGKWDGMMDYKPRDLPVFQKPILPKERVTGEKDDNLLIWVENSNLPIKDCETIYLPQFTKPISESFFISFFTKKEDVVLDWEINEVPTYIDIEQSSQFVNGELKLNFKYDAAKYDGTNRQVKIVVAGSEYLINVEVKDVDYTKNVDAIEHNKMVVINVNNSKSKNVTSIQNIGHSGSAALLSQNNGGVEYQFECHNSGEVSVRIGFVPQHRSGSKDIRYSVSIDSQEPQIVTINSDFLSDKWSENTLRNQILSSTKHIISRKDVHNIRIKSLDEDICIDQIMVDFEVERDFYLIPNR